VKLATEKSEYEDLKSKFEDLDAKMQVDKVSYDASSDSEKDQMRDRLNAEIDDRNTALNKAKGAERAYNDQLDLVNGLIDKINALGGR